ncbi:MAG: hypothetical protein HZB14_10855 [Actinobacteria bacterium]|nr:hypothetical protein [Actinomycetota bacterium]
MSPRIFGRGRKRDSREPPAAENAVLADYRLESVNIEHLDDFYNRVGYRERLDPGLLTHIGGAIEDGADGEIVYMSIWHSEGEALESWRAKLSEVEIVLSDSPDAKVIRRSSKIHRLYLGDDVDEFREGRSDVDPDCVGYVIDLPQVDVDAYDLICEHMGFPGDWPTGLLMHFAGRVDDFMRVVSIWRRAGQSRHFLEDRLMPAAVQVVRDHGLFPEIRPRELRIHLMALNDVLYE